MNFGEKNVTFNESSVYNVVMSRCATATNTGGTYIEGINKLTMNGTIKVRLSESYVPKEGDSLIVWKAATFAGTPKFDLPELGIGYYWDTTHIAEGKLIIGYDANSISAIAADEEVTVTVWSQNGVETGRFTCLMGAVEEHFYSYQTTKGMYLLHIEGASTSMVKKVLRK